MVSKKISFLITAALTFFSYITLDIKGVFNNIIIFLGEDNNITTVLVKMDIIIKVLIAIIILLLWFLIVNAVNIQYKKNYEKDDLIKYVKKEKELESLTIFGYSLSFAEDIRFFLDEKKHDSLNVKIYVPSKDFIGENLKEEKPIATRVGELNGRIFEWDKVKEREHIHSLTIFEHKLLPVACGVIINNKSCFFSCYTWNIEDDKAVFKKNPKGNRKYIRITIKDKHLWDYINTHLKCMELSNVESIRSS